MQGHKNFEGEYDILIKVPQCKTHPKHSIERVQKIHSIKSLQKVKGNDYDVILPPIFFSIQSKDLFQKFERKIIADFVQHFINEYDIGDYDPSYNKFQTIDWDD